MQGNGNGALVINSPISKGVMFNLLLSNNSPSQTTLSISLASLNHLPENTYATFIGLSASTDYVKTDKISITLAKNAKQILFLGVGPTAYLQNLGNSIAMSPGLHSMYPNPFRNHLNVQYIVPYRIVDAVGFSLTDLQGKCIWTQTQVNPRPGVHELLLSPNNWNNARLAPGIYLFRYTIVDRANAVLTFNKRILCL